MGDTAPTNVVSMQDSTLEAVKKGMLGYTQPGGSVYNAFRNCVVTAGAKTGTSELGGNQTENGVFVCFAPYDDPEIAVAIVIEHATWGSNLATTGVDILNAYFTCARSPSAPSPAERRSPFTAAPWPRRAFPTAHWSSPVSFPGRSGSRNYPWRAPQASGFAFPAH